MSDIALKLRQQSDDAKALLATYHDILGDDETARADIIEGETSLHDVIAMAVARVVELQGFLKANEAILEAISARNKRFEEQIDTLRTLVGSAMEIAGQKKLELPLGTVSLKAVPPAVRVTDESAIPSDFWKPQAPKLDKKALLAALKETSASVPGAELSNGGTTIQLRLT